MRRGARELSPASRTSAVTHKSALPAGRASWAVLVHEPGPPAQLARELGLPFSEAESATAFDLLLVCTAERLELRDNRDRRVGPVFTDLLGRGASGPRNAAVRRQPLARAIGSHNRTIVDATAGIGQDTQRLAALGYRVTAIERNTAAAALLRDGLRRAAASTPELAERVRILAGEARVLMPTLEMPDVVYLDPMFPPKRRKSAAPRKEIRLLRALVGDDPDAVELFAISLRCARDRVVVKRPDHAPPLAPKPDASYGGKLVRYDVYRSGSERFADCDRD